MQKYFANRPYRGQDVRVAIDESRSHEKVTQFADLVENVSIFYVNVETLAFVLFIHLFET